MQLPQATLLSDCQPQRPTSRFVSSIRTGELQRGALPAHAKAREPLFAQTLQ
jgi:hypothetical protein